ncbi:MAG: Fe-S-cluster-containing hydrogenase [Deltaproteobacteria bacterium]|nr:MAG: Fe-S-cluster-containing hydrogenase [Deltaproteobacteria bacterium]
MQENKRGGIKRRDFLKIIGVVGTTAAVTGGCSSEPVEQIIPYVIPPEDIVPGIPKWYASTCLECPAGCGIVVKNREGRAIKIEGNPKNPVNSGSLCARGQAALQGLYNPDRIRSPLVKDSSGRFKPLDWDSAEKTLLEKLQSLRERGKGDRIVFISGNVSGTLERLIKEWLGAIGGGRHVVYETFAYEPLKQGNKIAFGMDKIPTYHVEKARFVLSFGADFLETWLSPVEYAKKFSLMHSYREKSMGKFVQIEPRLSLTGANADEWIAIKPGTEAFLALGIAHVIASEGWHSSGISKEEEDMLVALLSRFSPDRVSSITDVPSSTIKRLAEEFVKLGPSIAIGVGAANTSTIATQTVVAINILNYLVGNTKEIVNFGESLTISKASSFKDIVSLVDSMSKGEVELLFVHNTNPVFTLPEALGFKEALKNVPFVVSFSSFMDETTELASLILPDCTTLEKWGDYVPREGIYGLIQPAMEPVPLFNTKPIGDVILSLSKQLSGLEGLFPQQSFFEYLRDSWKAIHAEVAPNKDFETFWSESLQNGGVFREVASPEVRLSRDILRVDFSEPSFNGDGSLYLMVYPSSRYYDGRGANKPWLQELPDPITTGVWDSWVELHPDTAQKLGVKEGDFLLVESPYGKVEVQAFLYKGIRPDTVAIPIGLGHESYGRYAEKIGVNPIKVLPVAYDDLSGGLAWLSTRVKISKTGRWARFVKTQQTTSQAGRGIAQAVGLEEIRRGLVKREEHHEPDMYKPHDHKHRWGMSIDLSKCVGCGACVTACYAENNVAFVGKEQVARGRHMSWIRIERFFEEESGFEARFIPMLCQHCDNAPCEPVCPVYATYHNYEGLNVMVYNRCVGTRYCSNNCTYKVRRFNWFTYKWPEPLNWQLNPDVTVRTKGVMEKCTFCSQRIIYAKDRAKDEGRFPRDGEITPACAQTCPTKAIVFGDLKDPESEVSRLSKDERGYHVLEEINTKPSITYLKKVKWDRV